jgi:hypothetical protein
LTDESETIEPNDARNAAHTGTGRRAYVAPELVEYGSVSKLTQTGTGSFTDGNGMMMMMACL